MKVKMSKGQSRMLTALATAALSLISCQWLSGDALAANTAAGSSGVTTITAGKALLSTGKYADAITLLKRTADKVGQGPDSCQYRLLLGQAYCKRAASLKAAGKDASADYLNGRAQLRQAIRAGHGNAVARQANQFMLASLPAEYLKPRLGEGTEMIAAMLGVHGRDRGTGVSRPKVFEFYADWCEPCKMLKPVIEKVKAQYGEQVEFVSYNVDDVKNEQFIDRYEVSPIPTVIFLSPDNQVVGYSIGFSGEKSVEKEIQKILPDKG